MEPGTVGTHGEDRGKEEDAATTIQKCQRGISGRKRARKERTRCLSENLVIAAEAQALELDTP